MDLNKAREMIQEAAQARTDAENKVDILKAQVAELEGVIAAQKTTIEGLRKKKAPKGKKGKKA